MPQAKSCLTSRKSPSSISPTWRRRATPTAQPPEPPRCFSAKSLGLGGVEIEGGAAAFEIDGMKVDIFHDEAADTVMVYGEIGQPPSEDDRAFGPAMLKANHLFGGTGGATLCQNPETGEYAIFQAFPLSGLNAESLAEDVARIVDKTEHWRNILNAFQVAEREKGAAAAEEVLLDAIHGGQGGFIQV